MIRRDLLRAARANIAAARKLYGSGCTGLALVLLDTARVQVARAQACTRMARYVWRVVSL